MNLGHFRRLTLMVLRAIVRCSTFCMAYCLYNKLKPSTMFMQTSVLTQFHAANCFQHSFDLAVGLLKNIIFTVYQHMRVSMQGSRLRINRRNKNCSVIYQVLGACRTALFAQTEMSSSYRNPADAQCRLMGSV